MKGAYLQSGAIKLDIFVHHSKEVRVSSGFVWNLKKLLYGFTKAERQRSTVVEDCLIDKMGLQRVSWSFSAVYEGQPTDSDEGQSDRRSINDRDRTVCQVLR